MEQSNTFREAVSKELIWKALFLLLEEKPFDKITVREICENAHVNRATFYRHFDDKYDLLKFGLRNQVLIEAGINDKLDQAFIEYLPHRALFEHIKANQKVWSHLLVIGGLNNYASSIIIESTERFFQEDKTTDRAHLPAKISARMYFGAVGMLATWWLEEGCRTPIAQLMEWVDRFAGRAWE